MSDTITVAEFKSEQDHLFNKFWYWWLDTHDCYPSSFPRKMKRDDWLALFEEALKNNWAQSPDKYRRYDGY